MKLILTFLLLITNMTFGSESKVIIHLLDHTGKKPKAEKFWIDWSKEWRAVEKSITIKGKEADKIIVLLNDNLLDEESDNLCGHDPIYGIETTSKDGETLKTSLCFKCVTWVKPNKRLTIKGELGIHNPLCLILRKHIELPKVLLKGQASLKEIDAEFSTKDIHGIRAFVYDYTQDSNSNSLLENGKLHKGVINGAGINLNKLQIKRLKKALSVTKNEGPGAKCYMPHHGFVFYNIKGKVIGHIELCFQCGNKDSSPKKLSTHPWDWSEIEKLFKELKVPILKNDKDYTKLFLDKQTNTKRENKSE